MKERMQKTSAQAHDFPQRARTESEWYEGVQTFMWMTEDNIVEVPFDKEHLLEIILSPSNLNKAYKAVVRNNGSGGIDKMSCEQLLSWLKANKDELIISLPQPCTQGRNTKGQWQKAPLRNPHSGRPIGATSHKPSVDADIRASVFQDKLRVPSPKGLP